MPPDSHWATLSHIAAFDRSRPAVEVEVATGAAVVAATVVLVPTEVTWLVAGVSVWETRVRGSSTPSTVTTLKVLVFTPSAPLVVTFCVPLAMVASFTVVDVYAMGSVVWALVTTTRLTVIVWRVGQRVGDLG